MNRTNVGCLVVAGFVLMGAAEGLSQGKRSEPVSFTKDIAPLISRRCLPCHAEDNFNPSELSLDSYEKLMEGGKHGAPIIPGNARASIIMQKTSATPPFGDRMPLNPKRKIDDGSAKWLTDAELRIVAVWINQGAKNN
jgi:hypothetical protein